MRLAIVSSYPPKPCGVGEFCQDLAASLMENDPQLEIDIFAINDKPDGYNYDPIVKDHFYFQNQKEYVKIADEINKGNYDLCILQHEFNLFGGLEREYIFSLTGQLCIPLVVIAHTIPIDKQNISYEKYKTHLLKINSNTRLFITMTKFGKKGLADIGIPPEKIMVIQHGSPPMPPISKADDFRRELGLSKRFVVSEFGLLRPSKGTEFFIEAVAKAKEQIPHLSALLIGTFDKTADPSYKSGVLELIDKLNLKDTLTIVEKFFFDKEGLYKYIIASHIIVTPYQRQDKISSGPLIFAMHAGIPLIATKYLAAVEMLGDSGLFIPFRDSEILSKHIVKLATDKNFYSQTQQKIANLGAPLSWYKKAQEYLRAFSLLA